MYFDLTYLSSRPIQFLGIGLPTGFLPFLGVLSLLFFSINRLFSIKKQNGNTIRKHCQLYWN